VLAGDSKCGKTCILNRFTGNEPRPEERPTIGVEFGTKIVRNHIIECKMQIWDTAGQTRFRAISAAYYRGALLVVLVFDVTNRESFVDLRTWLKEGIQYADEHCKFLILGNKIELPNREVSTSEAESFALENDVRYIEVDAMANKNIEDAFDLICELVNEKRNSDPTVESRKNAEDEKWKDKLLPLIDHVHDMKFHSIYHIYSPIIKISAPKLLDAYLHEELFHVTNDKCLWQKILNNLHLGVREELNLGEISQVLQIAMILESSSLKKYAMAQLARRVNRERISVVLPYMVNATFINEDHRKAVLKYLYQVPVSLSQTNKIRDVIDPETFGYYQIWKDKPKELSPLLEIDSEAEQKFTTENRFFAVVAKLHSERDTSGDLLLKSGGTEENNPAFTIKVHRFVVAARCDFIDSCLNSNLKEAGEGVIEIRGFNQSELSALVEYFYTNSFAHIVEPDTCLSILSMASYLMLTKETNSTVDHSKMLQVLEKTVLDKITDDTCLDLAFNAHKNQDEALKSLVIKYITEHYFDVSSKYEDQFSKLPKSLIFTIMNRMIFKIGSANLHPNNNNN
jgi:small GTP-binding protein